MSEAETMTNCNALKPERSRTFLELVVSYPAFCTYPEYEGKPYYAIKFEENGETIVGFGTYKPEVLSQYLQEYFIPSAESERTAKVEDIQVEWNDDEYINDRMGDMYHYGNCGNCGETVSHNQKYCHHCGVRLEWE